MASNALPQAAVAEPLPRDALSAMASSLVGSIHTWRHRLPEHSDRRTGLRILATEDYDAWLLRWPPHTSVDPHDHGESAGALAVAVGELHEIRWNSGSWRLRQLGPGDVITFDRGDVHDVTATSWTSLSVHVYSPPLKAMSFYDPGGRTPAGRVEVDDQEPTFAEAISTGCAFPRWPGR